MKEIEVTVSEIHTYTFQIPERYFKQLSNPKNRIAFLDEIHDNWLSSGECAVLQIKIIKILFQI